MGFGAAGAIATYYGADYVLASLIGLVSGLLLAGAMYLILQVFYQQQASSLTPTSAAIGCRGTVTVSIGEDAAGEVGLNLDGQYRTFSATSEKGTAIGKGRGVRVVRTLGSHLVVEQESGSGAGN
jgi:membrane protein implicated in regulation of membrane protease activity